MACSASFSSLSSARSTAFSSFASSGVAGVGGGGSPKAGTTAIEPSSSWRAKALGRSSQMKERGALGERRSRKTVSPRGFGRIATSVLGQGSTESAVVLFISVGGSGERLERPSGVRAISPSAVSTAGAAGSSLERLELLRVPFEASSFVWRQEKRLGAIAWPSAWPSLAWRKIAGSKALSASTACLAGPSSLWGPCPWLSSGEQISPSGAQLSRKPGLSPCPSSSSRPSLSSCSSCPSPSPSSAKRLGALPASWPSSEAASPASPSPPRPSSGPGAASSRPRPASCPTATGVAQAGVGGRTACSARAIEVSSAAKSRDLLCPTCPLGPNGHNRLFPSVLTTPLFLWRAEGSAGRPLWEGLQFFLQSPVGLGGVPGAEEGRLGDAGSFAGRGGSGFVCPLRAPRRRGGA